MVSLIRLVSGLPPYGDPATPFPPEWGRLGCEGTVVEFGTDAGRWAANFKPGLGGLELADVHPNQRDALVIASGDLWVVDLESRTAEMLLPCIEAALEVDDPNGWVLNRQGLALARLGPEGLIWHTRRLSWDGFDKLVVAGDEITGYAWSPIDDEWRVFRVDVRTGESSGGTYSDEDVEGWEHLAGA